MIHKLRRALQTKRMNARVKAQEQENVERLQVPVHSSIRLEQDT